MQESDCLDYFVSSASKRFGRNSSRSAQAFVTFGASCFTGPMVDKYGPRNLVALGGFLLTLGFCMLSLCYEYYQIIIVHVTLIAMGCDLM